MSSIRITENFQKTLDAKKISVVLMDDDETDEIEDQEIEQIFTSMKLDDGLKIFVKNQFKTVKNVLMYEKISIAQIIIDALGHNPRTLKISSSRDCKVSEEDKSILRKTYPKYKIFFDSNEGLMFKEKIEVSAKIREKIRKEFDEVHKKAKNLIEDSKKTEVILDLLRKDMYNKNSDGTYVFTLCENLEIYPHDEESFERVLKKRYGNNYIFEKLKEGTNSVIGSLKMKQ